MGGRYIFGFLLWVVAIPVYLPHKINRLDLREIYTGFFMSKDDANTLIIILTVISRGPSL